MMNNVALVLAVLAVLSILLSGIGTRGRWFHFRIGLALFALSGLLAAGAVISGLIARDRLALMAAAVGAIVLLAPIYGAMTAYGKPMIHDISTDPDVLDPRVAEIQRASYPDVKPLVLSATPAEAFARVRKAAESLGWKVVSARPEEGVLEATDTTGWFGFTDDVVVRVHAVPEGSRIDVRSTSRVGKSDVGMNAKRIRGFLGRV
jgi:uncharacterized protein (DUF1499 family)